jgi:hypothetical protein
MLNITYIFLSSNFKAVDHQMLRTFRDILGMKCTFWTFVTHRVQYI